MINKNRELSKIMVDVNNMEYNIEINHLISELKLTNGDMIIRKELFRPIKKNQIKAN